MNRPSYFCDSKENISSYENYALLKPEIEISLEQTNLHPNSHFDKLFKHSVSRYKINFIE